MIKLENVCFSYDGKPVLKNFSMTVNDGEKVCIFGESGCGKSTVIKLIAGLLTPDSGTVYADGLPSIVFQEDRLLPWYTARQNVEAVLPKSAENTGEIIDEVLSALGILGVSDEKLQELSGGMKRRVAIARAVCYGGNYLLLDEPFNGIDPKNRKKIAEIILKRYADKPIIIVSHNSGDAELFNARTEEMYSVK